MQFSSSSLFSCLMGTLNLPFRAQTFDLPFLTAPWPLPCHPNSDSGSGSFSFQQIKTPSCELLRKRALESLAHLRPSANTISCIFKIHPHLSTCHPRHCYHLAGNRHHLSLGLLQSLSNSSICFCPCLQPPLPNRLFSI